MSMKRYGHSVSRGAQPGSIKIPQGSLTPQIRITCYGPDDAIDREHCDVGQIQDLRGQQPVTWIDIVGIGDSDVIEQVG